MSPPRPRACDRTLLRHEVTHRASLAGVTPATAVRMVEFSPLAARGRASRSDALVMALTAAATLAPAGRQT